MRMLVVLLRRNELQTLQHIIPPHELPVLAYVHGEENCNVTALTQVANLDLTDPREEMARLTQKYGRDKANESLESRVAAVYGQGRKGLQALGDAIEYGQKEGLTVSAFRLGLDSEPAHDAPDLEQPTKRSQPSTLAHEERPAQLQPGNTETKREGTVRQRKRAAAGAK